MSVKSTIYKKYGLTFAALLSLCFLGCAEFQLLPPTKKYPVQVLKEELDKGEKITLGVVVESIHNAFLSKTSDAYKSWSAGIMTSLITREENVLLQYLGKYENFRLVDRNTINKIEEEYVLQMSGVTKSIDPSKLGELLNATHLYIITFGRYPYNGLYYNLEDIIQVRLVGVKDGRVLSVNEVRYYSKY